jgi:GntR family transcriptional regulator/MocR family aminotransferase
MRPRYRELRDTLVDRLAARVPELVPVGVSAGLHVMTWLPAGLSEAAVTQAALERGLGVYGLASYWMSPPGPAGLVFGYGGLTPKAVAEGIDLLADAIAAIQRG